MLTLPTSRSTTSREQPLARPVDALSRRLRIIPLCLGAIAAGSFAVLLILQSHLTFIADDWRFLLQRRGLSVDTFLQVHNDHIVIAPVAIYKALLVTFGMRSAVPYQVIATLVFVVSGIALFAYVRQRVGDWPALLASALVLFLGAAWNDLLWSFQVGFSGSMAAGVGALLAVQRNDRRGDVLAVTLLVVATSFSELGVSFALGVLVSVALGDATVRRLYVAVVPLALYGLWYLGWGQNGVHTASFHNLLHSPQFMFDLVSENLASLLGLATPLTGSGSHLVGLNSGRALLVATLLLVVWRARQIRRPSRGLYTVLAAGVSFWFLTALNASGLRGPTTGRYQYPGAVFLLLIGAELLRGVRLSKRLLDVATIVTVAAAVSGLIFLHDGYRIIKQETDLERATLAAAELGRGHESGKFVIAFDIFTQIDAQTYFAAIQEYGSPAFDEAQLTTTNERNRVAADQALAADEQIRLSPLTFTAYSADHCDKSLASPTALTLLPGTYAVRATSAAQTGVSLARFADEPSVGLGHLMPGVPVSVTVPPDRARRPWRMVLTGPGTLNLCAIPDRY